jgi:hypothetical protein
MLSQREQEQKWRDGWMNTPGIGRAVDHCCNVIVHQHSRIPLQRREAFWNYLLFSVVLHIKAYGRGSVGTMPTAHDLRRLADGEARIITDEEHRRLTNLPGRLIMLKREIMREAAGMRAGPQRCRIEEIARRIAEATSREAGAGHQGSEQELRSDHRC